MRVELWRKLSAEELMLLNCGVGEDSWESLGLQGDPTSPFWRRSALGFLWREWCWMKLQYFGHLMQRVDSLEKTRMLGGIGGRRRRGRQRMRWLDGILKSRHFFTNKGPSSQSYSFSSSHVWMWELDYKKSWALKNWCFWTMVLEKSLESPLDFKVIQPVHPKGISPKY